MDEQDVNEPEEDFAALLEQSMVGSSSRLQPGQQIEATVLKLTADWVFLDIGQKGEGVLDRRELLDAEGNPTAGEGDRITAYFLGASGGEMRFTTRIGGGGSAQAQMEEAWRSGIPVAGTVEKEIKGGYEVKLAGGSRAFCPFSQAALRRADPEQFIGRQLPFRITQFSEKGRNIVVSHRDILEEEQRKQREGLRETLREGMTVRGKITSLQKFGAFVDIGGVEGLLPMSELGWGRVEDIHEVLTSGQDVEVTIKSLDWESNRFSFSLKETLADPWLQAPQKYPEGAVLTGKVARLDTFGAFVTLEPGVDGLVHISKLGGGKRIKHPREALSEGQTLEVQVEAIDRENRRISLTLPGAAKTEKEAPAEDYRQFLREEAKPMGTFADLLQGKFPKKK
ncbi:MAG: 30S ribosomal protein S1 [Desulfuromonadales bacterium]